MIRKRSHYLLESRIRLLLKEEKEIITLSPEEYKDYLLYVNGNGNFLKNIKKFRNKEIHIDGDLNLSNMEIKSLGPVSYIDGKLNLKNTNIDEIGDVEASQGVLGNDYIMLHNYVRTGDENYLKGLYKNKNFVDDYELSDDRFNTEIILKMDDEEFLNMCDLDDDSIWFITSVNNYYSGYEFFDEERGQSDFYEGYAYNHFDDDNVDRLIDILKLVAPELNVTNKEDLEENSKEIYDKLDTIFPNQFDNMISDYTSLLNNAIQRAVQDDIEKEMTDVFSEFGLVEVRLFNEYKIEVGKLLKLFEEFGKSSTIYELFKKISNEKLSFPYFSEFQYISDYSSELDEGSLNRDFYYQLEKINEKIEESGVENLEEYKNIIDELKKKFEFNQTYVLPKDSKKPEGERRYFRIKNVDFTTNNIKFDLINPVGKGGPREMNLEDFNLFLYQPELFDDKIT